MRGRPYLGESDITLKVTLSKADAKAVKRMAKAGKEKCAAWIREAVKRRLRQNCAAIGGTCPNECVDGWEYCEDHLQATRDS